MSLTMAGCIAQERQPLCDFAYPTAAEECTLEIKMQEERKIYCGCEDTEFDLAKDYDGCKYVHTKGHDVYLCGVK